MNDNSKTRESLDERYRVLAAMAHSKVEELNLITKEMKENRRASEQARQIELREAMTAKGEALCTVCGDIHPANTLKPLYSEEGIGNIIVCLLHAGCPSCYRKIEHTGEYEGNEAKYFAVDHNPTNSEGFSIRSFTETSDWKPVPPNWKWAQNKPIGIRSELVKRYGIAEELALIPPLPPLDNKVPDYINPPNLRIGLKIFDL